MEAASKLKLWQVATELEEIGAALAENGGEVTPELGERLDLMAGAFEDKAESIALFVKECEANAAAAEIEATRLAAIAKHFTTKAKGLKDYLLFSMRRTGRTSVKTPLVKVWEQRNGRPSLRYAGDPVALPEEFKQTRVEVNGTAAFEAWKRGDNLPVGFVVEHGTHIRIS